MHMKKDLILLALLISLVSGCSAPTELSPTVPSTLPPSALPTSTMTLVSTPTTASTHPVTTLSAIDSKTVVLDMLQDNGGCRLPCLFGMKPGQTIESLNTFMLKFGDVKDQDVILESHIFKKSGGFILLSREGQLAARVYVYYYPSADNATVDQFSLHVDALQETGYTADLANALLSPKTGDPAFNHLIQQYALPTILSTYGQPTQVQIAVFPSDPIAPPNSEPISLVLLYEDQGFFVEYVSFRETDGNSYISCPWKTHLAVSVWKPKTSLPMSEIVKRGGMVINDTNLNYFKSIEEATSMTTDAFYETFKENSNKECVMTPISVWSTP